MSVLTFPGLRANGERLAGEIASAGLPRPAVYYRGTTLHVAWTTDLLQSQLDAATAVVQAHTPRRTRTLAAIKQALGDLTAAERNQLMIQFFAEELRNDPGLARRAGLALDGDEPDTLTPIRQT